MNYGKELCEKLKAIRKAVADANGIEYNPTECHHKGRCPGTCPVCDAEIEAINKALVRKTAMGEDIVIPEVSVEDICHSGIDPHPMNPFAGEARTPDEIKRIHQEYDVPLDEDETDEDEDYGEVLLGDIAPIEVIQGQMEMPGGIIYDPNNDEDKDELEE